MPHFVIGTLSLAVSENQIHPRLQADLPLVVLGSVIAAIGLAALVIAVFRRRSRERVLLWFGLFAGPYGVRLLANSLAFQLAFGHLQTFWLIMFRLVDFATIVPALLLFVSTGALSIFLQRLRARTRQKFCNRARWRRRRLRRAKKVFYISR